MLPKEGESHISQEVTLESLLCAASLSKDRSDASCSEQASFCMLHKALEFSSALCLKISADKNLYKFHFVDHLATSWHL